MIFFPLSLSLSLSLSLYVVVPKEGVEAPQLAEEQQEVVLFFIAAAVSRGSSLFSRPPQS
jgi:hypothetical protein